MNPADQRVTELVDKWLTSLELHLKYTGLTEEAYWQVQPWVRHQRPARWILDLAQTRARELKRQVEERVAAGDSQFAEALELMGFLANLVGAQNIERFIPLAEAERENAEALGQTQSTLSPLNSTGTQTRSMLEPTREMRMPVSLSQEPTPPPPAATQTMTPPPAATPPTGRTAGRREPRLTPARAARLPTAGSIEAQICADAARLLKWGREWHELPEAIARIADRPGVVEIRKVLRSYKADIEKTARA
jgi:hypothetical protein